MKRFTTLTTITIVALLSTSAGADEQTIVTVCTTETIDNRTIERCEVTVPMPDLDELQRDLDEFERSLRQPEAQPVGPPPSPAKPKIQTMCLVGVEIEDPCYEVRPDGTKIGYDAVIRRAKAAQRRPD